MNLETIKLVNKQQHQFIQKTLHYNQSILKKHLTQPLNYSILSELDKKKFTESVHCIPKYDSKISKVHDLFSAEDKSIIERINRDDKFLICDKDFKRFEQSQQTLFQWQLKIITQMFVYFKPTIKLIAFDEEMERLSYLVAVLTSTGFAKVQDSFGVNQEHFKNDNKKKFKMITIIQKTKLFDQQYVQVEKYGQIKNHVMQRGCHSAEETHLQCEPYMFKQQGLVHQHHSVFDPEQNEIQETLNKIINMNISDIMPKQQHNKSQIIEPPSITEMINFLSKEDDLIIPPNHCRVDLSEEAFTFGQAFGDNLDKVDGLDDDIQNESDKKDDDDFQSCGHLESDSYEITQFDFKKISTSLLNADEITHVNNL